MSVDVLDRDATRDELEAAWGVLESAGIETIAGVRRAELAPIVTGSPDYSDAEYRLAAGLLAVRAHAVRLEADREAGTKAITALLRAFGSVQAIIEDVADDDPGARLARGLWQELEAGAIACERATGRVTCVDCGWSAPAGTDALLDHECPRIVLERENELLKKRIETLELRLLEGGR